MNRLVPFAMLVVAGVAPAADPDPVKEKLDSAKAAYQAKLDALNNRVLEALTKREEQARQNKQPKLIDQLKLDREKFVKKGLVPSWHIPNPDEFTRQVKVARSTLLAAYDVAIKEYSKDKANDAQRAALAKEREPLAAEQAATVAGVFQKGTVWKGEFAMNKGKGEKCELEVTAIDGTDFKAVFASADGTTKLDVTGTFVRGKIEWAFASSRINRRLSNCKGGGIIRGKVLEATAEGVYANSKNTFFFSLKLDGG